ncbi:methyltransferase domain-containing protein [Silanimonas sp.]|jgi:SAM-dependent methyltransferase|uniref:methyltransferase domain-containing protein n=1 Tax=Silanimonas sp. TaxID=1929290 RepID=UPI0037C6DFE9
MPALQLPRQAEALNRWLADTPARGLLLGAQSAWTEHGADGGGQVWLRMLPELDWLVPEPAACFAETWTLAPDAGRWQGAWRSDLHTLPMASAAVSRIDLRFVLESVPSPERLVSECARVLRPDGRLLVFGLNPWGLARLRWARHGVRALPCSRVVDLLRGEGLDVVAQRTLGPRWRPAALDVAPGPARMDWGRVAWALLAVRRDIGLTPLRRPAAAWRASPGVPAA